MVIKIFSFFVMTLCLIWAASAGISSKVEATLPWQPDEKLIVFVQMVENPSLMRGEVEVEVYNDMGHKAKGYGTRAYLFTANTRVEAERIMKWKLMEANNFINNLVTYPLTKHQRNALVSLVYNIGPTIFGNSVALKHLNNGHINLFLIEAFDHHRGFVCAGGKFNKALIKRRAQEEKIWTKGEYGVMDV